MGVKGLRSVIAQNANNETIGFCLCSNGADKISEVPYFVLDFSLTSIGTKLYPRLKFVKYWRK